MKNLMLALLVGGLVFMTANASAANADVGKTKNLEIVDGSLISFDLAVCEYQLIKAIDFDGQSAEEINYTTNEFGVLEGIYTGEKTYHYYRYVNYWILYKHLLNKLETSNPIVAPRDKLMRNC